MTDFSRINGNSHKFKLVFQAKDFGRHHDLSITIVNRWGPETVVATIAPFGLLDVKENAPAVPTISGGADDGLGAEALIQTFMDYGWERGHRPAEYRKLRQGSVRWHLRAIWRLLWGVPR